MKIFGKKTRRVIKKIILVQEILFVFDFLVFFEELRFFFFNKGDDFLFVVFSEAGKKIDNGVSVAGDNIDGFKSGFVVF